MVLLGNGWVKGPVCRGPQISGVGDLGRRRIASAQLSRLISCPNFRSQPIFAAPRYAVVLFTGLPSRDHCPKDGRLAFVESFVE